MKNSNPYSIHPKHLRNIRARQRAKAQEAAKPSTPPPPAPTAVTIRTTPLKYLGTYVARTAIYDARLVQVTRETVSFRWKNRDAGRVDVCTLPGVEFVRRYLQHVLPRGLRSIRYYGFCHPAAKAKRLRVQCHAGGPVQLGDTSPVPAPLARPYCCPRCDHPMTLLRKIPSPYTQRGPPPPTALFTQLAKA